MSEQLGPIPTAPDVWAATTALQHDAGRISWARHVLRTKVLHFGKFAAVGLIGLVVNTVALAVSTSGLGASAAIGLVVATQVSTTTNFLLTEWFVFSGRQHARVGWVRYLQFSAVNNVALLLRAPLIVLFTGPAGLHLLVANALSLAVLMITRFAIADRFIWAHATDEEVSPAHQAKTARAAEPESAEQPATPETTEPVRLAVAPTPDPLTRASALHRVGFVAAVALPAVLLRVLHLTALGFNSDEVVYAGQAGSIAGDGRLQEFFPIFRAHPLLYQTSLSVIYQFGVSELAGRLLSVAFGLATILVTHRLALLLYGRRTALIAALFLAVMPYHVVVTRQVLLDGPMVFFSTLTLLMLAKFAQTGRIGLLYTTSAFMGLTVLTNERSLVLLAGIYLFLALASPVRLRFRHVAISALVFVAVISPFPVSVAYSGKQSTGSQFLAWQLFRRANHDLWFYFQTVPGAIGLLLVGAALIALWQMRGKFTWRETLLICWSIVPLVYFELWPVKGFQYLLPVAPVVAILAARALARLALQDLQLGQQTIRGVWLALAATLVIAGVGAVDSWNRINPSAAADEVLAGAGGVPGGREAGQWIDENVPEGATLITIGPSMANILEWYGDRTAFGLSVSPNPLHRNPVYEPILNPDLALRQNDIQYLVWDAYSASRSTFFSDKLEVLAERYHGRVVHQEFVPGINGGPPRPVITIYQVRP